MANVKDLTGKKIGKLFLKERKRKDNRTYYFCLCDCGNSKWIRADIIKKCSSCGCDREYNYRDLTGQRFGMLTAISVIGISEDNGKVWRCKCDCGNYKNVNMSALTSNSTTSCGCYQKEKAKENVKKAIKKFKDNNIVEHTNIAYITLNKTIKSNKSGVTGVHFSQGEQTWKAYITFQRKRYNLGSYKDKEDAIKVRKEAEEKIFGEFLEWYHKNYKENSTCQKKKSKNKLSD